jgi:hypothetical protein
MMRIADPEGLGKGKLFAGRFDLIEALGVADSTLPLSGKFGSWQSWSILGWARYIELTPSV